MMPLNGKIMKVERDIIVGENFVNMEV